MKMIWMTAWTPSFMTARSFATEFFTAMGPILITAPLISSFMLKMTATLITIPAVVIPRVVSVIPSISFSHYTTSICIIFPQEKKVWQNPTSIGQIFKCSLRLHHAAFTEKKT
ncbi:hypothetical protein [Bacillus velezensis]|uniref:hypothetical protein n=1 Tax=Bacillus velezensis TaxID=492670 RepID=UPI001CA56857|nr:MULTISPECIES: hypothetical protein [Bacillus amyloliquefaciens group]UFK59012.1 hypothetical protein LOZ87_03965 [Bacillus amyloliquefaciens]